MSKKTLPEFIAEMGNKRAAELFGISVYSAKAYRYQARQPRPELARKMVEVSKGALSLDSIYPPVEAA